MTTDDLNVLLNSWPEGTVGHEEDKGAIRLLDQIGQQTGYGALAQLTRWLYQIQCNDDPSEAAGLKRNRFAALGWKLPERFEEVAGS